MPFRNTAVIAATLATNTTGNRVVITGPNPGGGLPTAEIQLYTGTEGAHGSPATILATTNTGPIQSEQTIISGATSQATTPASIVIAGIPPVGSPTDPQAVTVSGSALNGETDAHQSNMFGSVPLFLTMGGSFDGPTFNPLQNWPLLKMGTFNGFTDGSGLVTITYGQAFPVGAGIVLSTVWFFGAVVGVTLFSNLRSKTGFQYLCRRADNGVPAPSTQIAFDWLAFGW